MCCIIAVTHHAPAASPSCCNMLLPHHHKAQYACTRHVYCTPACQQLQPSENRNPSAVHYSRHITCQQLQQQREAQPGWKEKCPPAGWVLMVLLLHVGPCASCAVLVLAPIWPGLTLPLVCPVPAVGPCCERYCSTAAGMARDAVRRRSISINGCLLQHSFNKGCQGPDGAEVGGVKGGTCAKPSLLALSCRAAQ